MAYLPKALLQSREKYQHRRQSTEYLGPRQGNNSTLNGRRSLSRVGCIPRGTLPSQPSPVTSYALPAISNPSPRSFGTRMQSASPAHSISGLLCMGVRLPLSLRSHPPATSSTQVLEHGEIRLRRLNHQRILGIQRHNRTQLNIKHLLTLRTISALVLQERALGFEIHECRKEE